MSASASAPVTAASEKALVECGLCFDRRIYRDDGPDAPPRWEECPRCHGEGNFLSIIYAPRLVRPLVRCARTATRTAKQEGGRGAMSANTECWVCGRSGKDQFGTPVRKKYGEAHAACSAALGELLKEPFRPWPEMVEQPWAEP